MGLIQVILESEYACIGPVGERAFRYKLYIDNRIAVLFIIYEAYMEILRDYLTF